MLSSGIHIGRRGGVALGGGSVSGAYDAIPSIVAAYGMRRLLGTYNGNLLRLRRSSDNAESDFGALGNGDLDTGAISAWLGADSGYVVTWYDQSGGARNATQATTAYQPTYTANTQNGRPSALFVNGNTTGNRLAFTATNAFAILAVAKPNVYTVANTLISNSADSNVVRLNSATAWRDPSNLANADDFVGTTGNVWVNGVDTPSFTASSWHLSVHQRSSGTAAVSMIGHNNSTNNRWFDGYVGEIVAVSTWTDAQRQAAEAAANAYWAVY